jgi:hypothetical protein
MANEPDPEELIGEALDAIALGFPWDGAEAEKVEWMAQFRQFMEKRAPIVQAEMLRIIREGE